MAIDKRISLDEAAARCATLPHGLAYFLREAGWGVHDWRRLLEQVVAEPYARVIELGERQTLFVDEDRNRRAFLVLSGGFDEHRLAVRASIRRPGQLLGAVTLYSSLDRPAGAHQGDVPPHGREGAEVRTRIASEVLVLPGDALLRASNRNATLVRALLKTLTEHAGDYLDDADQYDEAFEQYFPGRSGMLTPAPYDVASARMRIFFCEPPEDQREALEAMVPPGARWHPLARFWMLVLAEMRGIAPRFHKAASFDYDEVSAFVPIQVGYDPRVWCHVPFMFPDNIMAIYMGREIFGLPKRRSANFFDPLLDGRERFLMRRMLPEELRLRELGPDFRQAVRRPKQVDVLDVRYRTVPEAEERGAITGELLPALAPRLGLQSLDWLGKIAFGSSLSGTLERWAMGHLPERPCATAVQWGNRYLDAVPEALRTVPVSAWKRIFAPGATVRGPGPQRWRSADFEVDALAMTPFPVHRVERMQLIRLEGEAPMWATPGFPIMRPKPLSPIGLRVDVRMSLGPGRPLHDYKRHPGSGRDRARLDWGPSAGDDSTFA
ncbi:MAG: Acetoacetate decarboxylase [Pseudomonadota bacterium]|jgi:CRP-like cAMP-binding protein